MATARDFLSPMEDEKSLASELYRGLSGDLPAGEAPQTVLMGLEDLKALPSELFEAYVASILEQDGYLVKLADPKHSGGLSMMAQNDRQRALVKISHHIRPEMIEQDLTFLETLQWGSTCPQNPNCPPCPRRLASEIRTQAWDTEVWKLADLWARQRHALGEMDLIPRSESRVYLGGGVKTALPQAPYPRSWCFPRMSSFRTRSARASVLGLSVMDLMNVAEQPYQPRGRGMFLGRLPVVCSRVPPVGMSPCVSRCLGHLGFATYCRIVAHPWGYDDTQTSPSPVRAGF